MMFEAQDPYVTPFREIDNRAGFYVNGEWQLGQQLRVRAMHYDNRADPTTIDDGQYAWTTKFEHIGAHLVLPDNWELLFQWMVGSTVMGPVIDGAHAVDTEFDAKYLMLSKSYDRHRLSARYDRFEVTQNDDTDDDNNPDDGHAWTIAYFYDYSDMMSFGAEALYIKTHHCGWQYYGIDTVRSEEQFQLTLRLRFGN